MNKLWGTKWGEIQTDNNVEIRMEGWKAKLRKKEKSEND